MVQFIKTCQNPLRKIKFIDKTLNLLYRIAKEIVLSIQFYRDENTVKFKQENPNIILLNPHNLLNFFYNSDYGEDHFVYKHFFKNNKASKERIYFDIGANHPIQSNHTYFFEKKDWVGYAFEPIPEFKELWKKRKAKFFPFVLSNHKIENIPFYFCSQNFASTLHKETMEKWPTASWRKWKEIKVKSFTVNDICVMENISTIDFMSIDTEGHEFQVLQGINFEKINIKIMLIEHILDDEKLCFDFLTKKNYIFYARSYLNDIYIHSDFLKSIKK